MAVWVGGAWPGRTCPPEQFWSSSGSAPKTSFPDRDLGLGVATCRADSGNGMPNVRVARNPPGETSIGVDKPDVWGVMCGLPNRTIRAPGAKRPGRRTRKLSGTTPLLHRETGFRCCAGRILAAPTSKAIACAAQAVAAVEIHWSCPNGNPLSKYGCILILRLRTYQDPSGN